MNNTERINNLEKKFNALDAKLDKLIALQSGNKVEGKEGKKETKKSAPKKETDNWAKYTPKKDSEGFYIWRSYKACRNRYLADNGYGYDEVGWMSREDFAKASKPWTDKFGQYIKKSDR